MRVSVGFVKRVCARVSRTVRGGRLERVWVAGRAAGRRCLGRVVVRVRAGAVGRGGRVLASSRLGRVARERLGRAHVVGLLAGGGAAVALGMLSPLLGSADDSSAAARRIAPVERATSAAATSPTRFELARGVARRHGPSRGGRAYYSRTTTRHVPASTEARFLPLYRAAARSFGVSWQLIASIHRQETAFSTVPGTYYGLNAFGCCAGPMQFNVTNRPVTTWSRYRESFRFGTRPRHYPHRTRHHPSVYDDFDAIMAAGALLRDSGATDAVDGGAWSAAYAYYGHDRFGVDYADQVVARAQGWQLRGFCLNCPEDAALVAVLDDIYGVDARRQLRADERRRRHKKHKRHRAHDDTPSRGHGADNADTSGEPPSLPGSAREPVATPPTPAPGPVTTTTPPSTTTTAAPPTPPTAVPPAATPCTPVTRLLGCRP